MAARSPMQRAAFIEAGYGYVNTTNLAVSVLVALIVGALYGHVNGYWLAGWAGAQLLNQAVRRGLAVRRARAPREHRGARHWWIGLLTTTIMTAVIHVVFTLAVLDLDQPYVATVLFLVTFAMAGAGLTYIALSRFQLYLYSIVLLLPLPIAALAHTNPQSTWFAALAVWMSASCIRFGRGLHRTYHAVISQQLDLEQQALALREAQQVAERANKAKTRFVAAASHDLRQPLQALGTYSLLLEEAPNRNDAHVLAANMQVLLQSLEHSLDSLSDICKLDDAVLRPQVTTLPLQDVIDRAILVVKHAARLRGLQLRVRRTSVWVRSDPALLERIVVNLLTNAIRYTDQGKIVIGVRRLRGSVRLLVLDTGVGIASGDIDAAFAAYTRLHHRPHGLGLGLTIVRQFADLLGHRIDARSRPDHGSCFAITLDQAQPQGNQPAVIAATGVAPDFAGSTILILDDDPAIRASLRALFQRWGCSVYAARTCLEALAIVENDGIDPDLIVADYNLGESRTGLDAVALIRARQGKPIPAIVITGQIEIELICPAPGLVLEKPVSPGALRASVGEMLRAAANDQADRAPAAVSLSDETTGKRSPSRANKGRPRAA